jgi:hypothetical protein
MTPELEQFLLKIRENLRLADAQAEPIMAELRLHLQSDFEERLRMGRSETEAAQETMREFGDARAVAQELQTEHKFEPRGRAMLRNIGGALLAVVGYFCAQALNNVWSAMHFLESFFPGNPLGVVYITGWLKPLHDGLWWMSQHLSYVQQLLILQAIPLTAVGLLVGAVTRKRFWLLALAPWLLLWGQEWQGIIRNGFRFFEFYFYVITPIFQLAFLLLGVYLGRQSAHWRPGLQKAFLGLSILVTAATWGVLLFLQLDGYSIVAVFMLGFAGVAGLATWGTLRLMRRGDKIQPTGLAE